MPGAFIKYGSVHLPISDQDGVLADWLNSYQHLDETQLFGGNPGTESNRWNIGHGATRTNWARPNYPNAPPLRLNTLYWPMGASRFARGLFIATAEQVTQLLRESAGGARALTLTIDDGQGNRITPRLFMLPPRPIATVTGDPDRPHLLPLVDARYFAQFQSLIGPISQNNNTYYDSWSDLLAFAEYLDYLVDTEYPVGTATVATPAAVYLKPDYLFGQFQFGARGASLPTIYTDNAPDTNLGVIVDAACHSTGMRYLKHLDGSIEVSRFDSAATVASRSLQAYAARLIAGGELQGVAVPESVKVYGPSRTYTEGVILDVQPSIRWTKTVSATAGLATLPYSRFIFTSCLEVNNSAPYESLGSYTPDNLTELDDLATKIGADFYASQAHFYDYTFAGVAAWTFNPFDDCAIVTCDVVGGEFKLTTRVMSMPPGFGCEEMNHQTDDVLEIYQDVCNYVGVVDAGTVPSYPSPNATMNDTSSGTKTSVDFENTYTLIELNGTSGVTVDSVQGIAVYDRENGFWRAITADTMRS